MIASGRPSGTAMTRTVMPVMMKLIKFCRCDATNGFPAVTYVSMQKRMINTKTVSRATIEPEICGSLFVAKSIKSLNQWLNTVYVPCVLLDIHVKLAKNSSNLA